MKNYFVVRPAINEAFNDIRNELLEGRLRQGWGCPGFDLRNGRESFVDAWEKAGWNDKIDAPRRYAILSPLLNIKCGDIIIVPKLTLNNQSGVGQYFSIVECVEEYSFEPLAQYNDYGHILGVKALGTFDYRSENESANYIAKLLMGISLSKAVSQIRNQQTVQAVENLIDTLPPPDQDIDSLKNNMLAMQKYYLEGLIKNARNLPPNSPSREISLKKILEAVRMLLPDTLKETVRDLFIRSGYRPISAENDFVFEIFSERDLVRDLVRDLYNFAAPPKIFVFIKNPDKSLEENLAHFEKNTSSDIYIMIDLAKELDEKNINSAKERGVILVDGLTFANALVKHKIS